MSQNDTLIKSNNGQPTEATNAVTMTQPTPDSQQPENGAPVNNNPEPTTFSDWIAKKRAAMTIEEKCAAARQHAKRMEEWADRRAAEDREAAAKWPELIPLDDPQLPPFPAGCFPPWMDQLIDALAKETQTPRDLSAMSGLSMLGLCCAKLVEVEVLPNHREQVNIYTVTALGSGNRKSKVFGVMTEPVVEFEEAEAKRLEPLIAQAANERKIAEQSLERLNKRAAIAEGVMAKALLAEANTKACKLAEMKVEARPTFIMDDTTSEVVPTRLRENGGRLAIMSAEGGLFENMSGRYGAKGMPNFDIYLKAHNGDTVRVDRVSRAFEYVRKPALTLALLVQPSVVAGLAQKPGFRDRGLCARFLFALPKSMVGTRDIDAPAVPVEVRTTYQRKILDLLKLSRRTDEGKILQLSSEASAAWKAFDREIEPELGEGGNLSGMTDWAGKLPGAVARVAGLLHMAEHAGEGSLVPPFTPFPWDVAISGDTMDKAIRIGRYLLLHAQAAFGLMVADPDLEDEKYILAWIRRKNASSFTQREAFEGMKGRFHNVTALALSLPSLVRDDFIRIVPDEGGRGRPSITYEVHPALLQPAATPEVVQVPTAPAAAAQPA